MTRWPPRNFRPNPADYDQAKTNADAGDINMSHLLQAFLREFNADPGGRLQALKPYLDAIAAETRPRGRPKKNAPPPA